MGDGLVLISDGQSLRKQETPWYDLGLGARIVWTEDGSPIWEIAPRSKTPIGKYNSRKAGRFLAHRSRGHGVVGGEKLVIMRHEIDPDVIDFRTYHIRFDLVVGGTARSYIPPMLVQSARGHTRVEHVVGRPLRDDECQLLESVHKVCAEAGWQFALVHDGDVAPTACVRENIVAIQAERYAHFETSDLIKVGHCLRQGEGKATLGQLSATLGADRPSVPVVKAMMCHGFLTLPLDQRIDDRTLVVAVNRPDRKSTFQS